MINNTTEQIENSIKTHMEKIRKSLDIEGRRGLEINIEYPQIDDVKCGNCCKKINAFYFKMAESFCEYCEKTAIKNTEKSIRESESPKPFGEIIKSFIPYHDDVYISVLLEITHFNGYFKSTRRVCHTWDYINGLLIDKRGILKKLSKSGKAVKKQVGDMIMSSVQNGTADFSYTENKLKKYAYRVNLNNFFMCRNGIAFWFDMGTIAPESEGFPTFIVPLCEKEKELSEDSSK